MEIKEAKQTAVRWTADQQAVIDSRGSNLLVAAAAGSGKTAVLVERILSLICDPEKPTDVDRLLIVTFTNAAAAEMRERIRTALEERAALEPGSEHLQRQLTLIHHAQITTIHSFCLYVIRNYFSVIGLDPGFRVMDEGEGRLLQQDVLETVLEAAYEEKDEAFLALADWYGNGKNDHELEELILQLYRFSMGCPWPEKWLEECLRDYTIADEECAEKLPWVQGVVRMLQRTVDDLRRLLDSALAICLEEDGPYMYEPAVSADIQLLHGLAGVNTYGEFYLQIHQITGYARLSTKKDSQVSEGKKQAVKDIRDQFKKGVAELKEQYLSEPLDQVIRKMQDCRRPMEALVTLTIRFIREYGRKKEERHVVDFSDMEHFALNILVNEDGTPSETAEELSAAFSEIMIDEYQDSNLVQEMILRSVSGEVQGQRRMFMVGDVKQSIYRFRLARPDLFLEKYASYEKVTADAPKAECSCRRIDLHQNFRSRKEILSFTNYIFEQTMTDRFGELIYDRDAALYPGADYPPAEDCPAAVRLYLMDEDELADTEASAAEAEAAVIGRRIREMLAEEQVYDKKKKENRPVRLGDMVILLRSLNGFAEPFVETLQGMGIPAYVTSRTGYFSAWEVQAFLAYLKVLDNPRQDIPLAAALHSYFGGLTREEMAELRSQKPGAPFYEAAADPENAQSGGLKEKLERFWRQVNAYREEMLYIPVHELLERILEETGFGLYVAALPGGSRRKANVQMLVERAVAYEATSYKGLFHFIRYMDHLQKYEIDYGEANVTAESEDAVRILTIHKSKGLEFPVVFLAGLGRGFNQQQNRDRLLTHVDWGVGTEWIDPELRLRKNTLLKTAIQKQTALENLQEELRVLYVALTRAKEKLVLTAVLPGLEKKLRFWAGACRQTETALPYLTMRKASTYLDWIVPALMRSRAAGPLREETGIWPDSNSPLYRGSIVDGGQEWLSLECVRLSAEQEIFGEQLRQEETGRNKERFLRWAQKTEPDKAVREKLAKRFAWQYPWSSEREMPVKLTVSELKKQSMRTEEEELIERQEETVVPLLPRFMQEEAAVSPTARGTAYHKAMELLDFTGEKKAEYQLETWVSCGKMTQEERDQVLPRRLERLIHSRLGHRMARAQKNGTLRREQPFVIGAEASRIREEWSGDELVLVQGIVDAWFTEEDEIVIVDYKTDRVDSPAELAERYRTQLEWYRDALEQVTGLPVREMLLYSFALEKEIRL